MLLGIAALILGYFLYNTHLENNQHITILISIVFLLMLMVIGTSFFISVFVVRRINLIADTAKEIINTGDLSRRISVDTRWDDLSNLAQILNDLLDRIESLMEGVKRVSDNIAHDLRTPLSRLRSELETLKNDTENKEKAEKLIAEADQLLRTFNALLRIANIESGKRSQTFSTLNLDTVLNDIIEFYAPLAEEKNITISSNLPTATLKGDKDLLFQALANLLDNAIKFTPENGTISIATTKGPHITISDTGPGISEEDKGKVFDRFFRAETSRHTAGSGLGLSLVVAVIELHKGKITLKDNNPGLTVTLSF